MLSPDKFAEALKKIIDGEVYFAKHPPQEDDLRAEAAFGSVRLLKRLVIENYRELYESKKGIVHEHPIHQSCGSPRG